MKDVALEPIEIEQTQSFTEKTNLANTGKLEFE
jgi:hypothetical protein